MACLCLEYHRRSDADPKKLDRQEDIRVIPLIDLKRGQGGSLVIEATILVSLAVGTDAVLKGVGGPF